MVISTVSRFSVDLTARPTPPRAVSCSTPAPTFLIVSAVPQHDEEPDEELLVTLALLHLALLHLALLTPESV